jgi:uncharacterized membrane protein YcaP (DUF421 family)
VHAVATWFATGWSLLAVTAAKAALMYVAALVGLRLAHRRTLAQWTAIDFAAAVAVGAIIGRTAVASEQSLAVGVVALVTILAVHGVVTLARYLTWVSWLTDHRVCLLLRDGELRRHQMRLCGITEADLFAELRLRGIYHLDGLRYILYEPKGGLTIVPDGSVDGQAAVLDEALREADAD